MIGGHGHVTPRADGAKARCGGPALCSECARELAALSPAPRCPHCHDTGHVCENHPDRPWGGMCCDAGAEGSGVCEHGACGCGAGQPCGYCCSPIPEDGTTSIVVAFTPDWQRQEVLVDKAGPGDYWPPADPT